jgi:hypothetical protein
VQPGDLLFRLEDLRLGILRTLPCGLNQSPEVGGSDIPVAQAVSSIALLTLGGLDLSVIGRDELLLPDDGVLQREDRLELRLDTGIGMRVASTPACVFCPISCLGVQHLAEHDRDHRSAQRRPVSAGVLIARSPIPGHGLVNYLPRVTHRLLQVFVTSHHAFPPVESPTAGYVCPGCPSGCLQPDIAVDAHDALPALVLGPMIRMFTISSG